MRDAGIIIGEAFLLLAIASGCTAHKTQPQATPACASQPTSACASQPGTITFQVGPGTVWWKETILHEYVEFKDIGELKSVRGTQVKLIERDARKKTAAFQLTYQGAQQILVGKEGGSLKDRTTGHEYCWRLESVDSKRTVLNAVHFEHETNFDSHRRCLILQESQVDELNLGTGIQNVGTWTNP